jgi:hypothetical protein
MRNSRLAKALAAKIFFWVVIILPHFGSQLLEHPSRYLP